MGGELWLQLVDKATVVQRLVRGGSRTENHTCCADKGGNEDFVDLGLEREALVVLVFQKVFQLFLLEAERIGELVDVLSESDLAGWVFIEADSDFSLVPQKHHEPFLVLKALSI